MLVTLLLPFSASLLAAFGCVGTEPKGDLVLTVRNIAGLYYGMPFSTEEEGVVSDQLARGATIEIILYATGAVDGELYMPTDTTEGSGSTVSLAVTWQLDGNTVTLFPTNETFLEAMTRLFEESHLSGRTTIEGVPYRVVMAL